MKRVTAWALAWCMASCAATQGPPQPEGPQGERYAPVPPSIRTPDELKTRIGTLALFDGFPDKATVEAVYDHLDFMRGVRAYVQTLPGVSMMAIRQGMDAAGMLPNYTVLLTESMVDSKSLFLTQDSETVAALAWISLKGGPVVIETAPRAQGVFVDAWHRPLAETGKGGADGGRGGRYVLVPPAYAGYVPRTKYAIESSTFGVWAVFRGFLSKGSPKRAVETFKSHLKIYPLKEAVRPPPNVFIDVSGLTFNTVPPTDFTFFELLNDLIQEELNEAQDPEVLGILASLGIEKDKRFEPDERMTATLTEAAAVGNATVRALLFAPRDDAEKLYDDRQWQRILGGGSHTFIREGARLVDARARFHAYATAVTPTMSDPALGISLDSAAVFRDSRGQPLDGGRTYALTLPADVPAAFFWSLTVYDNQTRSMLQTDERFPSIVSGERGLQRNADGSITLRFGPNAPRYRKQRANWIQTTPGTGWNAILRLYGPERAWFDRSWRPGNVELDSEIPRLERSKRPPAMRTEVPASILTPDRMETRIGALSFVDGFPTDDTAKRVYDHLDFIRGVDTFLTTLSGASLVAMRRGLRSAGVTDNEVIGLFERKMDAHSLFLTPSSETVYAGTWLDLRAGAYIVESPPNTLGALNDFFSRHVADLSDTGPDEGRGRRFLFVPPKYDGQISDLYFNFVSKTYGNMLIWRGLTVDGDPAPAVESLVSSLRIEPLEIEITDEEIAAMEAAAGETERGVGSGETPEAQPGEVAMRFVRLTGKPINTIHANDFGFYEEIDELVQEEPHEALGSELLGLLASIGVRKGRPFAPDARMRALLSEAADVANVTARAIAFRHRDDSAYLYEDSGWYTALVGTSHRFQRRGVRLLDARTMFFYLTTMTTPAMVTTKLGEGSQSALAAIDSHGRYLDGGKSYRLTLPAGIPAKNFWSIVVYDPQTRSMLQTPRSPTPGLSSQTATVLPDLDGSTTVYFGPSAPAGKENNWIQTVPGKGWFTILRLYGPLENWFDESWRPGEIEEVEWR